MGKLFLDPAPKTMLCIELVVQVIDHLPAAIDLVVPGVAQVVRDIKFLVRGSPTSLQMSSIMAGHAWSSHDSSPLG